MTENKNDVLRLKGSCWANVPIEVLGYKVALGWEKFWAWVESFGIVTVRQLCY